MSIDLLDTIIDTDVISTDLRSVRQTELMEKLIEDISALDAGTGAKAREYTDRMTDAGRWTRGRDGNASDWISRMIARVSALRLEARKAAPNMPTVADGRYAVEEEGVLKFFKVTNGRNPGFVFLDVQASGDLFPVRGVARIRKILGQIAQDPHAAMVRYGLELGSCGRCGRLLTDPDSRAAGIGPICESKL